MGLYGGKPAGTNRCQRVFLFCLRAALSQVPKLLPEIDSLPFAGGLVGISGYDTVRNFEYLPAAPAAHAGPVPPEPVPPA